jgi:hypothetical protein
VPSNSGEHSNRRISSRVSAVRAAVTAKNRLATICPGCQERRLGAAAQAGDGPRAASSAFFSLSHKRRAFGRAGSGAWDHDVCRRTFFSRQRGQPLLLLVDMREWLPEDDLVFVVLDAVAALDLGEFRRRYRADGHGRAAFDPERCSRCCCMGTAPMADTRWPRSDLLMQGAVAHMRYLAVHLRC